MVHHGAAEALGGIATDKVLPVLRKWAVKDDAPRVVRESCAVAIDMWEVCYSSNSNWAQIHKSMRIRISSSMSMASLGPAW